jgi:hypothetical protein
VDSAVVERLLSLRPFRRFVIFAGSHDWAVDRPENLRVLRGIDTLVWSWKGTTDFIDLKLVERIKIEDDFGFAELDEFWK